MYETHNLTPAEISPLITGSNQGSSYFTCLALKISESWFTREERSFAWSSSYIVAFMDASLAAFTLPRVVAGQGQQMSVYLFSNPNLIRQANEDLWPQNNTSGLIFP